MQARSLAPGTAPVLQFAAALKLPLPPSQSSVQPMLNGAQPWRELVCPTAWTADCGPDEVGTGTTKLPEMVPVLDAVVTPNCTDALGKEKSLTASLGWKLAPV